MHFKIHENMFSSCDWRARGAGGASYLLFGHVPAECFVYKCFSSEIAFFTLENCLTCRTFLQDLNRDQACSSLVWKRKKVSKFA